MEQQNVVLVTLDGSELAEKSLEYLSLLAPLESPHFELISVKQAGDRYPSADAATAYLSAKAEELKPAAGPITCCVRSGIPYISILHEAQDERVALIVTSTHGHGWPEHRGVRLGSVADGIIREAPCPVLVVTPYCPPVPQTIKELLVPLDGSALAETALPAVALLAERFGARVNLMRVNPSIRETRAEAELWEADATAYLTTVAQQLPPALETELVVATASPADTIQVEARLLGADLIVMAAHGGHGFKSYALGDVTERLLLGPTPVLIVRLGQLERLERWLGHGTTA